MVSSELFGSEVIKQNPFFSIGMQPLCNYKLNLEKFLFHYFQNSTQRIWEFIEEEVFLFTVQWLQALAFLTFKSIPWKHLWQSDMAISSLTWALLFKDHVAHSLNIKWCRFPVFYIQLFRKILLCSRSYLKDSNLYNKGRKQMKQT